MNTTTTIKKKNWTPMIEFILYVFISVVLSISIWIHANECKKRRQEKKRQQSLLSMRLYHREKGRGRKWIKRSLWRNAHRTDRFWIFHILIFLWFVSLHVQNLLRLVQTMLLLLHSQSECIEHTVSSISVWKRPRADMSVCQNLFGVFWSCY